MRLQPRQRYQLSAYYVVYVMSWCKQEPVRRSHPAQSLACCRHVWMLICTRLLHTRLATLCAGGCAASARAAKGAHAAQPDSQHSGSEGTWLASHALQACMRLLQCASKQASKHDITAAPFWRRQVCTCLVALSYSFVCFVVLTCCIVPAALPTHVSTCVVMRRLPTAGCRAGRVWVERGAAGGERAI
jgi:hypothetical protein